MPQNRCNYHCLKHEGSTNSLRNAGDFWPLLSQGKEWNLFFVFFPREILVLHLNESYECIVEDYATIQSDVREEFLVTWKT